MRQVAVRPELSGQPNVVVEILPEYLENQQKKVQMNVSIHYSYCVCLREFHLLSGCLSHKLHIHHNLYDSKKLFSVFSLNNYFSTSGKVKQNLLRLFK